MNRYNVLNGTNPKATSIGIVHADDEIDAVSTLQAFKNGFGVTDPGLGVPSSYVEWAHPQIKQLSSASVITWRAYLLE